MKHQTNFIANILVCASVLFGFSVYGQSNDRSDEVGNYETLHRQYILENPLYPDIQVQAYVNKVGQRMAAVSDSNIDYKFFLIDSFDVNAFAAPGGYIYFNRGLLIQLKSEAQLAAVLGHEVGHIAGRHHSRGSAMRGGGTILTILAGIMTGSGDAMEAADLMSQVSTYGHQRELEMEADEYGLEYLEKAGYDPNAMVEVIQVLRTNRRFVGEIAASEGRTTGTYHGVFATHPRDDQRLRRGAANLSETATNIIYTDDAEFRAAIDGILYGGGTMPQNVPKPADDAIVDETNKFSIRFPEGWTTDLGPPLRSTSKQQDEWLELRVSTRNGSQTPAEYVQASLPSITLFGATDIRVNGLSGHMGVVNTKAENAKSQRLAVIFNGNRVYEINYYNTANSSSKHDDRFRELLQMLAAYRDPSASPQKLPLVRYVQAKEGMTFQALNRVLYMGAYGEQQLRAINGYYPYGEPEPGEWIKIVQ